MNVIAAVSSNDSSIHDETKREVTAAEFVARFEGLADKKPAAYRWAIIIRGDGLPRCSCRASLPTPHGCLGVTSFNGEFEIRGRLGLQKNEKVKQDI